jgi:hypothetical protein
MRSELPEPVVAAEPPVPSDELDWPLPAEVPPVPSVEAEPVPALPLPAADPPVPTDELDWPLPAEVPPVPRVEAEPEPVLPLPAADPPVPTDELDMPPPAEVPPVPSVEAEPEPEPPADDPPVPTDELDIPPPAEVPPVPIVELDCASTNAALPARNVAVNAASERFRLLISSSPEGFSFHLRMQSGVAHETTTRQPDGATDVPAPKAVQIEMAVSILFQVSLTVMKSRTAKSPTCAGLLHRYCGSRQWTICTMT